MTIRQGAEKGDGCEVGSTELRLLPRKAKAQRAEISDSVRMTIQLHSYFKKKHLPGILTKFNNYK